MDTSDSFHSQSTKENTKSDIEDSIKQKNVYKLFEWFDDWRYTLSLTIITTMMCMWVKQNKENPSKATLYLFQQGGPQTKEILRKLFEWRRSGNTNDDVGHKGGGNKRLIYGMNADKVSIFSRTANSDNDVLFCETRPNAIYELTKQNINEEIFRSKVDTSEFVKLPELKDVDDLPGWYTKEFKIIQEESGIDPNYLIKLELPEIPPEFINVNKWNEFVNQILAKQYEIPIYFKNELIGMDKYETHENIDLVGFGAMEYKMDIELYNDTENIRNFYLYDKKNKKYNIVNSKTDSIETLPPTIKLWGIIRMFIVVKEYLEEQLKKYNKNLDKDSTLKESDIYGVYMQLNRQLNNYLPIQGNGNNIMPDGKNNKIGLNGSSTNKFRIVIIPDNELCCEKKYFDALAKTETIKALSSFLDRSHYKKIISQSMGLYKENMWPQEQKKSIPTTSRDKKVPGIKYLIYIAGGLYKFGCCDDEKNYPERLKKHKNESIDRVKEFTGIDIKEKSAVELYAKSTTSPKSGEEEIKNIIRDYKHKEKITLFQNEGSHNDIREYFICSDFDYIMQEILPQLNN